MFVRLNSQTSQAFNLAKQSKELYVFVFTEMTKPEMSAEYKKLNEFAKIPSDIKPVDIYLNERMSFLLKSITKQNSLTVYYEGTWRPLARLHYFSITKPKLKSKND